MVGGIVAGVPGGMVGAAATGSKESGQLGITWAGTSGSSISEGGGQAGIAGSVGGSGGQMSVSSGGAGAEGDVGGQVDFIASAATALGGSLRTFTACDSAGGSAPVATAGSAVASASTDFSGIGSSSSCPGVVGTVRAHARAGLSLSPLGEDSVFDQSGSPFFCAGAAGDVCAQTGVVSRVVTG
jgi:hypothetical protein